MLPSMKAQASLAHTKTTSAQGLQRARPPAVRYPVQRAKLKGVGSKKQASFDETLAGLMLLLPQKGGLLQMKRRPSATEDALTRPSPPRRVLPSRAAVQRMLAAVSLEVGAQVIHTHRNGGLNWLVRWQLTGAGAGTANGYIIQEIFLFDELALCATGKIASSQDVHYFEAWKVTNGAIELDGIDGWHLPPTPNGVTRSARVRGLAKFVSGTTAPDAWGRGVSPFSRELRSSFVAPAHWSEAGALVRSVAIESAACPDDRFYNLWINGVETNWRTRESDEGFVAGELLLRPDAAIRKAAATEILRLVADYLEGGGVVSALIRRALELAFAEIRFPESVQDVLDLGDAVPGLLRGLATNA